MIYSTGQVGPLIDALRMMRKWGFTVQQDSPGKAQPLHEQLARAKTVAAQMLGVPSGESCEAVDMLAGTILSVATAREDLSQFL